MRRLIAGLAVCLFACITAAGTDAQSYPARPITIVVPFAPGSGTDSITRIIAQYLQAALGQSVVVENKVGASGVLAASFVARANPDGYTLLVATNSTHSANPYLFKNIGYDLVKDFAPAGTPKEIVDRLNAEVQKTIANPDAKAKIAVTGFDAFSGPLELLAAFIQSELVNWGKLIKEAGIEQQ